MHATPTDTGDSTIVIYGVSGEAYQAILAALPEHTYDDGTLAMRSRLDDVSWQAYQGILAALPDHSIRHTYFEGTLEMMSPSQEHDWIKRVIGRLIEAMALELDIPIKSVGSTTQYRSEAQRGLQPDESYYVANEPLVRGKLTYDPDKDPPPDLAIEVDITSSSLGRLEVYASIGVSEVWRHDGNALIFYQLDNDGNYARVERSLAFPIIRPGDILRFLQQIHETEENSVIRSFVKWAKSQTSPG